MKRVLTLLILGTVISGLAAYAATATARPEAAKPGKQARDS
jgi:hypothetical protein